MLKPNRFVIIILSISVILSIAISSKLLFIFNNSPINNEAPIPKLESLNLQNYLEHKVQKTFEAWFLRNFFMRNMLARIKYSVDLALFNELSVVSHVRLLMGKNNHIFAIINKAGVDSGRAEVNLTTQVQEQMLERLKVIKELTNKLDKYGTQVIVVISPSKASIYKDELTDKYVNKIDNPPYYHSLVKYLKELNINYIDTVEILKRRHMEYPSEVL